jgi:DNA-binding MarR family transcriptional regulator
MELNHLICVGRRLTQSGHLAARLTFPGLVGAESVVLADLLGQRFSTVTEIAQRIGYTQGRVSTAVAALREAGLVGSRVDEKDGRKTVLFASELGSSLGEDQPDQIAEGILDHILSGVAESEREMIKHALEILHDALKATDPAVRERFSN